MNAPESSPQFPASAVQSLCVSTLSLWRACSAELCFEAVVARHGGSKTEQVTQREEEREPCSSALSILLGFFFLFFFFFFFLFWFFPFWPAVSWGTNSQPLKSADTGCKAPHLAIQMLHKCHDPRVHWLLLPLELTSSSLKWPPCLTRQSQCCQRVRT